MKLKTKINLIKMNFVKSTCQVLKYSLASRFINIKSKHELEEGSLCPYSVLHT